MASPIFTSFLIKKYNVQLRSSRNSPWKDYKAYRSLEDARRTLREQLRQNPEAEGRIVNRMTGQVIP